MAQVMKEAMLRDLHSVYAYVRGDNKVGRKYLLYIVIHIPYSGCYPSQQEVWFGDYWDL